MGENVQALVDKVCVPAVVILLQVDTVVDLLGRSEVVLRRVPGDVDAVGRRADILESGVPYDGRFFVDDIGPDPPGLVGGGILDIIAGLVVCPYVH